MKEYLSGLTNGFMIGVGAVCAGLLYLDYKNVIKLKAMDPDWLYQHYTERPYHTYHKSYYSGPRHYTQYVPYRPTASVAHFSCDGCEHYNEPYDGSHCRYCKSILNGERYHYKAKASSVYSKTCSNCAHNLMGDSDYCFGCGEDLEHFEALDNSKNTTGACNCVHCKYWVNDDDEEPCSSCYRNTHDDSCKDRFVSDEINPECSGCVYEGMPADFDPCKSCKRAFDGCSEDYYECRENEPEPEEEEDK